MEYKIAVLKGDGIGPEIVDITTKVLEKIGEKILIINFIFYKRIFRWRIYW